MRDGEPTCRFEYALLTEETMRPYSRTAQFSKQEGPTLPKCFRGETSFQKQPELPLNL